MPEAQMSIYGTILTFDGDDHDEGCVFYVEGSGIFEFSGRQCDCTAWQRQPIVYEGSHVLPSDDAPRGGGLEIALIPDHVTRDGRDDAPEGALKDWLRIGIWNDPSAYERDGKPYVAAGDSTVVLTRPLVEQLRDALTAWLDREAGTA